MQDWHFVIQQTYQEASLEHKVMKAHAAQKAFYIIGKLLLHVIIYLIIAYRDINTNSIISNKAKS